MENLSGIRLTDDQHFLLHLIMGAYFAPDLKNEKPHKSALQRRAEGLPQYSAHDLAGSQMKTMIVESVYYYVLRKAQQSVLVKQPCLLNFIHGGLPEGSGTYPRFDDLFPPELHRRSKETIDNIVFINNPNVDYIEPRDVERFKRLTGLKDFVFDKENVMMHVFEDMSSVEVQEASNSTMQSSRMTASSGEDLDRGMIFLPSCPSREVWNDMIGNIKSGFAVTGSAARGHVGPVLGLMDIGESADSYLFRVSLPGVRRDERDFSCEVESDGRVIIKGVTVTGERIVEKFSQAFEMQSHNLCPPGPFSISFKLPGPVDPQQFHGTFGTDGILEGIAFKARRCAS